MRRPVLCRYGTCRTKGVGPVDALGVGRCCADSEFLFKIPIDHGGSHRERVECWGSALGPRSTHVLVMSCGRVLRIEEGEVFMC